MTTGILEVPVDRLVVDSKIQPRVHGIKEQHVKQLLEALAVGELPPVVVTPHPDGRRYIVVDGAHRLEAYCRAGRQVVPVRVLDAAGYWESFVLNREHGLPLSVQDRKVCAAWLKRNRPELSIREIAREVGLAPSTVQAALQEDRRRNTGGGVVRSTNVWHAFFLDHHQTLGAQPGRPRLFRGAVGTRPRGPGGTLRELRRPVGCFDLLRGRRSPRLGPYGGSLCATE
jgi:hypothetical protein